MGDQYGTYDPATGRSYGSSGYGKADERDPTKGNRVNAGDLGALARQQAEARRKKKEEEEKEAARQKDKTGWMSKK